MYKKDKNDTNCIQNMIDVNTIIGEPIETSNNIIIIPISKVSFGFAAGGSEFKGETVNEYQKKEKEEAIQYRLPFGGGSGAGVSINPIAFLVIQQNNVKLMPVEHASSIDKLLDYIPEIIEKTNNMINRCVQNKKEETNRIINHIEKTSKENREASIKKANEQEENKTRLKRKIEEERERIKKEKKEINDTPKQKIEYEYEYDETSGLGDLDLDD